jgi:hypothetical protein
MADSFAEGWTSTQIGKAYAVSPEYAMKLILEEFGKRKMAEVILEMRRQGLRQNMDMTRDEEEKFYDDADVR